MADDDAVVVPITKAEQTGEVGSTGLRQMSGVLGEEFLRELAGDKAKKVFREMADNDPTVGSMLFAIDMFVRQVEWRVDPHPDDPVGEETAEFVWSCFDDLDPSWDDTLSSILSFLPYGFSVHEIVYKNRNGPEHPDITQRSKFNDGRFGWRKLSIRSQDTITRWLWDDDSNELIGLEQVAPPKYDLVEIPMEKVLHFRTTAQKENPEGRSALRNAYRPWFFKKRIEEIEGVGIERDLAGFPIIYAPARLFDDNASAADKAVLETLKKQAANIKRDQEEGMVFPAVYDDKGNLMYKFELLTTGGRRQFDTDAVVVRYDQRIAQVVLADVIQLGHEAVGSYALADSKQGMFALALTAWIDGVAAVFNSTGIPRLMRMNGLDPALSPKLTHDQVEDVDLAKIADYLDKTVGSAVIIPDPALEEFARSIAGLPARQDSSAEF